MLNADSSATVQFGITIAAGIARRLSLGPAPNGAVRQIAESKQPHAARLNVFALRIFVSI
jgi:hypothetical protein